jgi:hypothetical protein
MPFCTDSNWTVEMFKDAGPTVPPIRLDSLFFELKIINGIITNDSKVFLHLVEISRATGTCQDDPALGAAVMVLTFNWGATRILMTGIVHVQGVFNRIKVRFVAFPPVVQPSLEIKRLALIPPDVGDTGTGNGTQT